MIDIELFKNSLLSQSKTCGVTSDLYHDIFIALFNSDKCFDLFKRVNNIRAFVGGIEPSLLFVAYFHYIALTDKNSELRKYFKTYGGNYTQNYFHELELVINKILLDKEDELFDWLKNTKLQTNEVNRCSVIYPLLLSLGLENISLIELGCSAGLILLMDYYEYKYSNEKEELILNKGSKPNITSYSNNYEQLKTLLDNSKKLHINQRIGIDLNPLDLNDIYNQNLLKSSIWDDPIREQRLSDSIEVFKENNNQVILKSLDYTKDLANDLSEVIDVNSDIVIYTSVSTYQINQDLYEKLFEQLCMLSKKMNKKVYFLEFEGKRIEDVLPIKLTEQEPFYLAITTFPEKKKTFWGTAHFHGKSFSII